MNRVLLVGDEKPMRILLKDLLTEDGYDVFNCGDPEHLEFTIQQLAPDLIVWHIGPRYAEGLYWLQQVRRRNPRLPAILFTDQPWLDLPPRWVSAHNYLVDSLNLCNLKRTVHRVLVNRRRRSDSVAALSTGAGNCTLTHEEGGTRCNTLTIPHGSNQRQRG